MKNFLAGKRGYCPVCNVKLTVPTESAPALAKESPSDSDATGSLTPRRAAANGSGNVAAATRLPASPVGRPGTAGTVAQAAAAQPVATQSPSHMLPSTESEAHWYVCPPSGGQYGPVGEDVVQQWIAEGRITPDSLVWKSGWADWAPAGQVFNALKQQRAQGAATAQPVAAVATGSGAAELPRSGSAAAIAPKKGSGRMQIAGIVFLVLAAILLAGALFLVLRSN